MLTPLTSRTIAAQKARRRFGELLDKVFYRRESFIVARAGEPKAVIVPMAEYNEVLRIQEESRTRLFARIDQTQKKLANRPPQEIEAVLQDAVEATRHLKQ